MNELIKRKFKREGDIEKVSMYTSMRLGNLFISCLSLLSQALALVDRCGGLRRAKDLAIVQAEQAMEAALGMAASPARDGLIKLAALVIQRTS